VSLSLGRRDTGRPVVGDDWVAFGRTNEGVTDRASDDECTSWSREEYAFGTMAGVVPTPQGLVVRGGTTSGLTLLQEAGRLRRVFTRRHPRARMPNAQRTADSTDSTPRAVGTAVALGVGGILVLGAVTLLVGAIGRRRGLAVGVLFVGSVVIGQYLGFVGLGLLYLRSRGLSWPGIRSYLGIRLPSLRDLLAVVAGYVAIIVGLVAILAVALQFLPEPAENQGAAFAADNPEIIPPLIVVMFLVVGPCEEFLYRGIVQNRLRERLPAAAAIALAASIFAVVHVVAVAGSASAVAVTLTVLLVPGVVLGAVYEYTGNLVVPWLLHSLHNSVLLAVLLLADQATDGTALLAGLALGP
jgi:membrane protease YdiL (CAAX protease family)